MRNDAPTRYDPYFYPTMPVRSAWPFIADSIGYTNHPWHAFAKPRPEEFEPTARTGHWVGTSPSARVLADLRWLGWVRLYAAIATDNFTKPPWVETEPGRRRKPRSDLSPEQMAALRQRAMLRALGMERP